MPDLWMPGVRRYDTGRRLPMRGNGPRLFTWHTFEAPYTYSPDLRAACKYLSAQRSDPHFVLHPITGALVQMLPMTTGGRTLRAPGNLSTNTWGTIHGQVEVIAYAKRPWTQDLTAAGRASLQELMDFLRSWGVEDRWCHGVRPPAYPGPGVYRTQPRMSGHFHHAGWVGNDHGDPGQIDDPWQHAPAPTPIQEELEMSTSQYEELKAVSDEILNQVKHHLGGKMSEQDKDGFGTDRDLPIKDRINLTGARVNELRARQWDVIKATRAVVDALAANGVGLSDAQEAVVAAALSGEVDQ